MSTVAVAGRHTTHVPARVSGPHAVQVAGARAVRVAGPSAPRVDAAAAATPARSRTTTAFLHWSRRATVVGWLAWAGLVVWGVQAGVLTSVEGLQGFLAGFGLWAPLAYALVGASEAVFPVIPGSVTILAAPLLFGPVVGIVTAYAATCLGSIAVFFLSRHVGTDLLHARFRPATVERYLGWLGHRHFTRWFAIGIALPVAPDDLLCYLAGMSQMRPRTFMLLILLLKPWALILYTFGILALVQHFVPGLTW
jgi:uncharacterized membrane protein YdjX (TVP38/TMEM64 family)